MPMSPALTPAGAAQSNAAGLRPWWQLWPSWYISLQRSAHALRRWAMQHPATACMPWHHRCPSPAPAALAATSRYSLFMQGAQGTCICIPWPCAGVAALHPAVLSCTQPYGTVRHMLCLAALPSVPQPHSSSCTAAGNIWKRHQQHFIALLCCAGSKRAACVSWT